MLPIGKCCQQVLLAAGGAADIVDPAGWADAPPAVARAVFAESGHLPFIDEREASNAFGL